MPVFEVVICGVGLQESSLHVGIFVSGVQVAFSSSWYENDLR
jgi:hypothetical protein